MKFPQLYEAPKDILEIDGNCGLIAAWMVLHYFGKPFEVPTLVKACRYTKRDGVFTVSLAACLKEHGLQVSFHSDPDNNIGEFERRGYVRARRVGLLAEPALELSALLRERKRGRVPIVIFDTCPDAGHFSPLLSRRRGVLRLPLVEGGTMPETEFLARWSAPGILRQSIVAGL